MILVAKAICCSSANQFYKNIFQFRPDKKTSIRYMEKNIPLSKSLKLAKKLFPLFNVLIHSASPHPWLACIQKGEKIEKQCLPWRHPFPPPWSWLVCIQKSHRHLWWGLGWRMEDCESVILNGIDNDGVFPSYCWADLFSLIFLSALVINQWHPTISPLCYELILQTICFLKSHTI